MNKKKKFIVTAMMTAGLFFTGHLVNLENSGMLNNLVGVKTVEAGFLENVGKGISDTFEKVTGKNNKGKEGTTQSTGGIDLQSQAKDVAKKAAKDAISKSLGIDLNDTENKKADMIANLKAAALCYYKAFILVSEGGDLDSGNRARLTAIMTNISKSNTDLGPIKSAFKDPPFDMNKFGEKIDALLESGDKEKIARANEIIRQAKGYRKSANIYKGLLQETQL